MSLCTHMYNLFLNQIFPFPKDPKCDIFRSQQCTSNGVSPKNIKMLDSAFNQMPHLSDAKLPFNNPQASALLTNLSLSTTVNPIQILTQATSIRATKHLSRSVFFRNPALRKSHAHHIQLCPGPHTLYSEGRRSRSAADLRKCIWWKGILCSDPRKGIPGCCTVSVFCVGESVTKISE